MIKLIGVMLLKEDKKLIDIKPNSKKVQSKTFREIRTGIRGFISTGVRAIFRRL